MYTGIEAMWLGKRSWILESILLDNPHKTAVLSVGCASFSFTLFPSTQLSVNMLWYSTLWTASLAMNVCGLRSLWRVSKIVFWTTVRSAVFPMIVSPSEPNWDHFEGVLSWLADWYPPLAPYSNLLRCTCMCIYIYIINKQYTHIYYVNKIILYICIHTHTHTYIHKNVYMQYCTDGVYIWSQFLNYSLKQWVECLFPLCNVDYACMALKSNYSQSGLLIRLHNGKSIHWFLPFV